MGVWKSGQSRSGQIKRSEFDGAIKQVPVHCRGIAALAMYVNTVEGMKWRCNRCGAEHPVIDDVPGWFAARAPTITQREAEVFMTLASLMSDHAVH